MTYEVWSKASRTVLGGFSTEAAALDAVRTAIAAHGAGYALGLAIIREDSRGRSAPVAEGQALVERALGVTHGAASPR